MQKRTIKMRDDIQDGIFKKTFMDRSIRPYLTGMSCAWHHEKTQK